MLGERHTGSQLNPMRRMLCEYIEAGLQELMTTKNGQPRE